MSSEETGVPQTIEQRKQSVRAKWARNRRLIAEAKAGGCARCHAKPDNLRLLHLHHRDPTTKLFKVSAGHNRSLRVLLPEIAKCDVLCAPCHKEVHSA